MELPSPGDQYNLKWNNHLANFIQTFIEHQNGESLVDVTLSCEGQYIKAHKLILSACSDYFHSIFQVHGAVAHPFILLNGVRFIDLKYILHFMYHGEVKVIDKDLPSVLALGETLQIKGLSSVKLRDMPPEQTEQPIEQNINKYYSSKLPIHELRVSNPTTLLPSEIPYPIFSPTLKTGHNKHEKINMTLTSKTKSSYSTTHKITPEAKLMGNEELPPLKKTMTSKSPHTSIISINEPHSTNNELRNASPKPPHAFMIFASEWRKKLTVEHPEENNKEISIRLGNMWKNLLPETKNIYYQAAKRAEADHQAKYPEYINLKHHMKRKVEVFNDSTNTSSSSASIDPMEIVEIQEQVSVTDSE